MKISVVQPFVDKFNHSIRYKEGDIIEVDDARAANLISRSIATLVVEEAKTAEEKPKKGRKNKVEGE